MKIKDHFLTQEIFEVEKTSYEGVLKTQNLPENLDKYYDSNKYISHHKDNSLKSKIYQLVQKFNEKYKLKIISKFKTSGKILDYGCGDGSFLAFMKNHHFSVTGYEPNEKARNIASSKIEEKNLVKSLEDIENHSLDIITLWHVLEHIPNPEEILASLRQKLKNDGILLIALPNHQSFDAKFYKENWAAWDVPRHIFHYGKEGAIRFFNLNQFDVLYTYPLPFDSLYVSMTSEMYAKNLLGLLRFPLIGILSNLKGMKNGNFSSIIYVLKN